MKVAREREYSTNVPQYYSLGNIAGAIVYQALLAEIAHDPLSLVVYRKTVGLRP
jgi:hypothetical protein